jgi:hypothetical protein
MTGDFIAVSRFNPVLVEASMGFVVARPLQGSVCLCATVRESVQGGFLLGLAPFGALTLGTKIDNIAH